MRTPFAKRLKNYTCNTQLPFSRRIFSTLFYIISLASLKKVQDNSFLEFPLEAWVGCVSDVRIVS